MKIVLFHPVALPPRDYGGVERVVQWLASGLVARGHEVHVAALEGSRLPDGVRLIAMPPHATSAAHLESRLPAGVDLVHFMAPAGDRYMERLGVPTVLTVHGNGREAEVYPLNAVFLSADHARRHGATVFVHNGIDPSEYAFTPHDKGHACLFLSKTSWRVKNLAGAMRHCRKAGAPLRIAGGNRPWSLRAQAALWPGMTWVGPVSGGVKARELARAKALVFPVQWAEPFGLVVVEALMSGTPVLASRRGSMPELIGPEVGALPESGSEWIGWLRRPELPWSPEACRDWAMKRFHFSRMAESYEKLYKQVVAGESLHAQPPRTLASQEMNR